MAVNAWRGTTNSNWSVPGNWSLGAVPTSTDANVTTFDASSPNCTVNVASNCQSLDFTGYANVLTMSSQLAVTTGTVTFQANQSSRIAGAQSLTLNGDCSIIANGATWNTGISTSTPSSTKTLTGTLTVSGLFIANMVGGGVFNGGTLILNGGLATQQIQTGTTAITLGGGTWSGGQTISNPITIAGDITLGTTLTALNTTVTYSSGTVTTTGSTATFRTCTLNTSGMTWNTVTFGPSNTCTLTSNLNCNTLLFPATNATIVNGAFNINCNNLTGGSAGTMAGTATIVMVGSGTWSMTNGQISSNLIFNSTGTITISGTVIYTTGTLTYTAGTVIATGSTLTLGATNPTLINCHKINFDTVQLTSTSTVTMNEFFSGSPNLPVKIRASAAQNYNITFQNGFEKIAKYVKVSNLTLASGNNLLILNNKGKYFRGSNNIGNIRYTNPSPNGIAKGNPTIRNSMTAPIGGYVSDPVFN
jgi:hypothetical protein